MYKSIQMTHLRLDPLMFGVLLAYAAQFWGLLDSRLLHRYRWLLILGGFACYAPGFFFAQSHAWFLAVGVTVFYLGGGMLVVGSLYSNVGANPLVRAIAWIGKYSYGIYLWHMMVEMWFLPPVLNRYDWIIYAAAYVLTTLGAGVALSWAIEAPALRLREQLFPPSGERKQAGLVSR
jgi:peptidoglycan/LPS O-acetylase OafA/YrhL